MYRDCSTTEYFLWNTNEIWILFDPQFICTFMAVICKSAVLLKSLNPYHFLWKILYSVSNSLWYFQVQWQKFWIVSKINVTWTCDYWIWNFIFLIFSLRALSITSTKELYGHKKFHSTSSHQISRVVHPQATGLEKIWEYTKQKFALFTRFFQFRF